MTNYSSTTHYDDLRLSAEIVKVMAHSPINDDGELCGQFYTESFRSYSAVLV